MDNIKVINILVSDYCKFFRKTYLKITTKDLSNKCGISTQNLYAFESGKANNIKYIYCYYQNATEEQRKIFTEQLFQIL